MKDSLDESGEFERDDAALWAALGKLPRPEVSPYFARRVLRESVRVDEEGGAFGRWTRRFLGGLRLPHPAWSGAFAAALVCVATVGVPHHRSAPPTVAAQKDAHEEISQQDVEVIANLDNLMAYEENRIWTDDSNKD